MHPSTEVRWFFQDRKDISEIEKWFGGFELSLDGQDFNRQDHYLKLAGITNLGLKIRDPQRTMMGKWIGKLEAKLLVKDLGPLKMEDGSSGLATEWVKFSFSLPGGEDELEEIIQMHSASAAGAGKGYWIKIDKNRILLTYDADHKKFVTEQGQMGEGCGIELTAIKIGERIFYSFGLEGYSPSGKHEANFFEALNIVFSEVKHPGLAEQNSLTYPGFLASII